MISSAGFTCNDKHPEADILSATIELVGHVPPQTFLHWSRLHQTSDRSPPLLLTLAHVLHTHRLRTSWEILVCWTLTSAFVSGLRRGSMLDSHPYLFLSRWGACWQREVNIETGANSYVLSAEPLYRCSGVRTRVHSKPYSPNATQCIPSTP